MFHLIKYLFLFQNNVKLVLFLNVVKLMRISIDEYLRNLLLLKRFKFKINKAYIRFDCEIFKSIFLSYHMRALTQFH